MAYPPYQNRLYGHAWFSFVSNSTVKTANIQLSDANANSAENVQSMVITQIISSGPWTIARQNSTSTYTQFTTVNTNYHFDFSGHGTALNGCPGGDVVVTTADANASILIQVAKQTSANGTVVI